MNEDPLRNLHREIRSWTERPPGLSPRVARTRVLARIGERRRRPRRPLAIATGLAAAGLVAMVGWVLRTFDRPGPGVPSIPELAAAEPSPSRLLIYELKSGTKLYIALAQDSAHSLTPSLSRGDSDES